MDILQGIPDGAIDCIITDPPYGLNGADELAMVEKVLQLAFQKAGLMAVVMDWRYGHRICSLFEASKVGEIIWEYGWISGGRCKVKSGVLPTHNTFHLFGDRRRFRFLEGTIIHRQPGFSSPRQCSFAKKTGHPYEKPVKLMEFIAKRIDCHTILDPFAGTGATLVAAKQLGRRYIGIEIIPKYCKITSERLAQCEFFNQPHLMEEL